MNVWRGSSAPRISAYLSKRQAPLCLQSHRNFHSPSALCAAANHYDTLHLPKNATRQQIKAQFYRLSKEYHPDVKTGNEQKFQAISEAYAILGHADTRKAYDASMTASSSAFHYAPRHHHQQSSHWYPHEDVETASTRRARANYAWEHTRKHHPRHTNAHAGKHNPFDHRHPRHHQQQQQQHYGTAEDDHFDRMQAREAWRASNMSSGARKRAIFEAERIEREENLRNTSGTIRAIQVVSMFLAVLWLTGSFKAAAQEKEGEVKVRRREKKRTDVE